MEALKKKIFSTLLRHVPLDVLDSLAVVHPPLLLITQYCVSLSHLLELLFMILLLHLSCPGMSVRMVNHSTLPVCLFDLLLICILVHSQDLVVVLPLRLLQLQLGLLQQVPVLLITPVALVHFLIIPNSLIILLRLHITLGPSQESLSVAGVQLKSFIAICYAFSGALQLSRYSGPVEVQLCICTPVVRVYRQRLTVQLVSLVKVSSLEGSVTLLFLLLQGLGFPIYLLRLHVVWGKA